MDPYRNLGIGRQFKVQRPHVQTVRYVSRDSR